MWRHVLRPLLFRLDPERAHHLTMALFAFAMRLPFVRAIVRRRHAVRDPALKVVRFGRELPSPIGLAAGFDKDARWFDELAALGFGFVEVGTLTAHPQPGNPRPRLFRVPKDRALVNRFGFNNRGSLAASEALGRRRIGTVLGINIGKSKVTPNEEAASDYVASLERLSKFASYVAVNVSSPNTEGLRRLQAKDALGKLLGALVAANREGKPLFVKIAPDLTDEEIDDVVDLALEHGLAGVIATNTTISREGLSTPAEEIAGLGAGGLSGAPLRERSRAVVRRVYERAGGKLVVVGVGGVFDADDAWELLRAGASLVEVYTGFIYEGPGFVRALNEGLARRLRARGGSLDDVVGEAVRQGN